MKYKFCYTNESKGIDDRFIADIVVIPGERATLNCPGCAAEIDIDDIYFADNPERRIGEPLYDELKKELDRLYEDIISKNEEWRTQEKIDFD